LQDRYLTSSTANSNKSNSDKKSKAKHVEGELNRKENCGSSGRTVKVRNSENPKLQQTSKSKHPKAKWKVKGSNPSQRKAE
jgi:hypothetical protein